MTVQGPIEAEKLGITTIHEHLLIDLRDQFREFAEVTRKALSEQAVSIENLGVLRRNPLAIKDNMVISDINTAEEETLAFKKAGGDTIVDATSIGIGRDARALRSISRYTGVNIVAGCGYYYHDTHPADMDTKTIDDIAQEMLRDMNIGMNETDIRAGVIGEIGLSQEIHPNEKKVLAASAIASLETGAGIIVHIFDWSKTGGYPAGIEATDLLKKYGGWGYEHILTNIVPMMLDEGITREQIDIILRENPKRFLDRK